MSRLFYYIPEGMDLINLVISPGHYGRSLSSIKRTEQILHDSIPEDLKPLLSLRDVDASIDIDASQWDKSVCRVRRLQIKIKPYLAKLKPFMAVSISAIADRLDKAGFSPFPEDFDCY